MYYLSIPLLVFKLFEELPLVYVKTYFVNRKSGKTWTIDNFRTFLFIFVEKNVYGRKDFPVF
jgi:hypothetical protein